jgi:hypothetical protein
MAVPGIHSLAVETITAAGSQTFTAITDLDGLAVVTLVAAFVYGSGGTSVSAVVQTSFDGGTTWLDVRRFDFTTSSGTRYGTVARIAGDNTAYAALSADGGNAGLLGNRLRAKIISVGTYAGSTTVSISAHCS